MDSRRSRDDHRSSPYEPVRLRSPRAVERDEEVGRRGAGSSRGSRVARRTTRAPPRDRSAAHASIGSTTLSNRPPMPMPASCPTRTSLRTLYPMSPRSELKLLPVRTTAAGETLQTPPGGATVDHRPELDRQVLRRDCTDRPARRAARPSSCPRDAARFAATS